MKERLRNAWEAARGGPLWWFYVALVLVRLPGLFWGLPATDGWDNDGVAPRDFLPGLIQTFTPGEYYTYPPLHAALLTVVNLPIVIVGALTAPSLDPLTVRDHFLQPWLMTPIAVTSRIVAIGFSCLCMHAVCRLTAELGSKSGTSDVRLMRWTAAVLLCNVPFAYYGQTTNLDGPYVAWTALSLLALVRALRKPGVGSLRSFVLFASCAITTKDQAYASFLLSVPPALLLASAAAPRGEKMRILRRSLLAGAGLALTVLLVDGAFFNPRGFLARMRFLVGPASKQHENYAHSIRGALACMYDACDHWNYYYPYAFAPVVLLGLWLALRAARAREIPLIAALLPALCTISFTLAFNVTAGRTDHRFVLPQSVFLTIYLGIGVAWLAQHVAGKIVAAGALAYAFWPVLGLEVAMGNDPRYAAETWMRAHMHAGASVEVYGESVYLPRFQSGIALRRVAASPVNGRNPIANATEFQGEISEATTRKPEYIVLTQVWAARYLMPPPPSGFVAATSRGLPPHFKDIFGDVKTHEFLTSLAHETAGYTRVAAFSDEPKLWSKLQIHSAVSCDCAIWIYQRNKLAIGTFLPP